MKERNALMRVWGLCLFGFFWLNINQDAVGQCTDSPITSFSLKQSTITDNDKQQGEITVELQGGKAPFVYKLIADHRGKGMQELQVSPPTQQHQYTFRGVPANTDFFYRVEVESTNQSEGAVPVAVCQKRSILNIELK